MSVEWSLVTSTRIVAEAYNADSEEIYVEFPNGGVRWWYGACPEDVWLSFTADGQSRGKFINEVLNDKPNGRLS